jgi:hypothetical protein
MSFEADGNGGASARELVLERDLVVRALPLAGITELIRRSPSLDSLHTHRCRHLNGFRDRISDLMDSSRNKQLGLAEVITTIP